MPREASESEVFAQRPEWATQAALKRGLLSFVFTLAFGVVVASVTKTSSWLYLVLPVAFGIVAGTAIYLRTPPLLSRVQRGRAATQQDLREKLKSIHASMAAAQVDIETTRKPISKLTDLSKRMLEHDPVAFQGRIVLFDRAKALLEQSVKLNQELIAGYQRACTMMEIEIDTLEISEILPDSAAAVLEEKLEELSRLKEELRRRKEIIAADDEVNQLLSS
jgi:hypothetical protein